VILKLATLMLDQCEPLRLSDAASAPEMDNLRALEIVDGLLKTDPDDGPCCIDRRLAGTGAVCSHQDVVNAAQVQRRSP
jgi:hypothetical protein